MGKGLYRLEPLKWIAGKLDGRYLGEISVSVYKKAAVKDMPQALQAAYELGKKCVEAMRATPQ